MQDLEVASSARQGDGDIFEVNRRRAAVVDVEQVAARGRCGGHEDTSGLRAVVPIG
ncbi:hypothetical protein GCM10009668_07300 [Nocardioides dubius]|uniref:Uncharacterized protein n=1 Tax=Nocardioides dubius TaxID=317019 RepID=A0ABN1TNY7_9ACTN